MQHRGDGGDDETVGEQIRRRRLALGLSDLQLAVRSGIHRNALARIQSGEAEPRYATVQAVLRALDEFEVEAAGGEVRRTNNKYVVIELPGGGRVVVDWQPGPEFAQQIADLVESLGLR